MDTPTSTTEIPRPVDPKKKRLDDIVALVYKHAEQIKEAGKGKVEFNFSDARVTVSITVFDEAT